MIRDATRDDIVDVINLAHRYLDLAIDGYTLDKAVWITHVLTWLHQAENGEAFFKVAYDGEDISGFVIGLPTSWHYSADVYLELKELFVNEDLSQISKAKLTLQFTEQAEVYAKERDFKGISAFSIRDNSAAYANFFCNKLGWTKATGAKKIFGG
jgi:hypothetical protein